MDKRTSQQLIKSRKAVKEKFQKLKSDIAATEFHLEKTYRPIIQPLKQLITKIEQPELLELKQEAKEEYKEYEPPYISTPQKKSIFKTPIFKTTGLTPQLPLEMPSFFGSNSRYESDIPFQDTSIIAESEPHESSEETTPTTTLADLINQTRQTVQQYVDRPGYDDYLEDFQELPRTYIDANIRDTEDAFDHRFGIVHDFEANKFTLGLTQEPIDFKENDIVIKQIKYPGTVGLYELLFKKEPKGYSQKDLDNYMDILERTNAYKDELGNVNTSSNRYAKFRTIILPYLHKKGITKKGARALMANTSSRLLFDRPPPPSRITRQTQKIGKGLTLKNNNKNVDYVYWDNPNELITRLQLLLSSTAAGHTGHNNEIISIIEELREAKIIQ